jgi:glycosyltransferase involved in cell wall biosynthesis
MISILMPIYNGIEFIGESVNSIIEQTFTEWELLIGINGHCENSDIYKIALQYENCKIKVYDLYNIKGKSNTLNELIKYCRYDYIALLDVDDYWFSNKLEVQYDYLYKYDIIGSKCIYFGESNLVPFIPTGDISNFDFKLVNPIINSSSIIRKSLCYWDNTIDGVEDYDLWLKLNKQNYKFYNCDEILVKHRIHCNSSFNSKNNNLLVKDLLEKY